MSSVPFFVQYQLEAESTAATPLFATVLLVAIVSVVIWVRLLNRYEVVTVWRTAFFVLMISFIPLYFANSILTAILAGVVLGLGFAGVISTMDLIQAEIIDEDSVANKTKHEGIFTSAAGFMNRLNGIFVSFAFFYVNYAYGFESGDNPGNNSGAAARFLLTVFPFILMFIAFIISWFLNFDQKVEESQSTTID